MKNHLIAFLCLGYIKSTEIYNNAPADLLDMGLLRDPETSEWMLDYRVLQILGRMLEHELLKVAWNLNT